ncbi:MAG: response regulator transcription factor [Gammaproteobacteria bacterium]
MQSIQSENLANFCIHILDPELQAKQTIEDLFSRVGMAYKYAAHATDLLTNLRSSINGCVLLDVRLPFYSITELQQLLKKQDAYLPVIFMGQDKDIQAAIKVLKAGAFDFLLKPLDEQHVLEVISQALRKRQEQLSHQNFLQKIEQRMQILSMRESEVLQHLLQGLSNKKIGHSLEISTKTVEQHRANIMRKMQVESLADLVTDVVSYQLKKEQYI